MVNKAYRFFFVESCINAWKEANEQLKENDKQPYAEMRKNIAAMAKVQRLIPFEDLSLVGNHAERFSIDPDEVFWKCSMATVIAFAVERKEREEFRERFNSIWQGINGNNGSTGDTGS